MKHDKRPKDVRGQHIRLYHDIFQSNAYKCLSMSAKVAHLTLLSQLRSTNNGDLSLPLSVAKMQGIESHTTLAKSLRALVAVGLVAVTRKGGCTKGGQRLATLYRMTDVEAYANPAKSLEASKATNDWRAITTLGLGREAIRQAEDAAAAEAAKAKAEKTKAQGQKMTPTGPKNGVVEQITGPKNGSWTSRPRQKVALVKTS
jgi:high-affinity K+ transport system ATPase subunit B